MNCWAVLGIDRTADTAVIRKAYKRQLLVYHPEDDPEGYQKVRSAYTAAMNAAKRIARLEEANVEAEAIAEAEEDKQAEEDIQAEAEAPADADHQGSRRLFKLESAEPCIGDTEKEEGSENERRYYVPHHDFARQVQDKTQAENDFMERLERLINDDGQRNDAEAWKELLGDDVLWDIRSKSRIDDRMLRLFSERYHSLNDRILKIIESHTGLFDKINKETDAYPARFVDTYALATQNTAAPRRLKQAGTSTNQVLKRPEADISGWRYCLKIPISWIVLLVIGNLVTLPLYLLSVVVRFVLFIFRRNWKIVMWEYTFTHINRWGKRYDFKYIDIIKIEQTSDKVIIYLKGKRIRIKVDYTMNVSRLLAKMSRYERMEGVSR